MRDPKFKAINFLNQAIAPESNFIQSVSDQIIETFQQHWDRTVTNKLEIIRMKAFQEGPIDLYDCMRGYDLTRPSDIKAMKIQLEAKGYDLEIEDRTNSIDISMDTVNIDFSKLKVRVKKTIMEV